MSTIFKDIRRIGSLSIRCVAGLHLFNTLFFEISQTEGASMLPTIQMNGDFCIVDKRYKNGRNIQIGDLIVARKPTQPENWVCKRVTGMPGDIVLIDPAYESINNLENSIENTNSDGKIKEIKPVRVYSGKGFDRNPYDQFIIIPEGHVWITGDNLSDSIDSRTYSVLPMGLIGGKIIVGMYLNNWLSLSGNYYRVLENTFTEV